MSQSLNTNLVDSGSVGEDSARRILRVARTLFAEKGFAAVSMRDIAAAARMSKANVFHHFNNKAELYQSVLTGSAVEIDEIIRQFQRGTGEPCKAIEHYIQSHLEEHLQDREAGILFIRALIEHQDSEEYQAMTTIVRERFGYFVETVNILSQDEVLKSGIDSRALSLLLLGSHIVYWLLHPHLKDADT